ncbi:MAG: heavy metal translocating P-type ATPase [Pseudomonadota bacterium]
MTAACPACVATPGLEDVPVLPDMIQLSVPQVRCAACISTIEGHLSSMADVRDARVNLSQKRLGVITDRPVEDIIRTLSEIGYDAFALDAKALDSGADPVGQDLLLRLGIAGFAMMNVMLLSVAVWSGASGATRDLFHLISAAIALPVVLYAAQPFFKSAWRALRVGRLNMDVPISLAIGLAGPMSLYETLNGGEHAYFDAALSLTFFLLIGRYLEHRTRSSARSAAKELAALEEHTAQRQTDAGTETVTLDQLQIGDHVYVATGMRVPVDGTLISDVAQTDRSFLTGESDPVQHGPAATLNAGEINLGAPFTLRADAVGASTRLRQIAQLVETAETARNRYTSLADRAARIYAPAVHLLAFATFLGWIAIDGDVRHAINVAIAVLIITCPCALALAVPAVSTAAISRLYQMGFLVKSGTALERLSEVEHVILDKTGTLTQPGFSFDLNELPQEARPVAAALANASAHPLSRALANHLASVPPAPLNDLKETAGRGVTASFNDSRVALGRADWLGETGRDLTLQIGEARWPLPYIETLTEGAEQMIAGLSEDRFDIEIISGDTEAKTKDLADRIGVQQYRAHMTPEDKNARIEALTDAGIRTCMMGDGLNDTVALSAAHASIAPGSALDAARSAADVVAIGGTLTHIPALFEVSRRAVRLSRQNFAIALAYNAIAVPIAILGHATPLAAALAMSLSSITVSLNALRVGRST